MEVRQFLLICLAGLASPLLSQEKEQPPSPITAESLEDTFRARESGPRLELPDVIIYGKDIVILERTKPVYETAIKFETRGSERRLSGRRIGMKIPKLFRGERPAAAVTHVRAQYGSHRSHLIEFLNSSRIGDLDYTIKLSHLGLGKWETNSQTQDLGSDVKIDWSMGRASLISTVGYRNSEFGYYGESADERETFSRYHLRQLFLLPHLEMTADISRHRLHSFGSEVTVELSGRLQHRIESIPVGSEFSYLHAGGNGFLDLARISLYSHFSPYDWLSESFGLEYTSANRLKRLSPFVKVHANFGIVVFGYYRTFVEAHTMVDHIDANYYVRNPRPVAEEHVNSLTLGACYTLQNGVRTQLSVSHENLKSKPFWKHADHWVISTTDTRKTLVKFDLTGTYFESVDADLSVQYIHYSPSVPYALGLVAEAKAGYETKFGMAIEGIAAYVGTRDTPDSHLPAYVKFDLNLKKDLAKNLLLFGGARNLFDAEYETLDEYPEPGMEVYLGAKLLL
jgi:hypothetical protein